MAQSHAEREGEMTYKEAVQATLAEYIKSPKFQTHGAPLTVDETTLVLDFLGMFLADAEFKLIESEKEKS
jgi:hypothetical protein